MAGDIAWGALIAVGVGLLLHGSRLRWGRSPDPPTRPAWGRQVSRLLAGLFWFVVLSFLARWVCAVIVAALAGANLPPGDPRLLAKELAAVHFLARYGHAIQIGATAAAILGTWTGALPGTNPWRTNAPVRSQDSEEWQPPLWDQTPIWGPPDDREPMSGGEPNFGGEPTAAPPLWQPDPVPPFIPFEDIPVQEEGRVCLQCLGTRGKWELPTTESGTSTWLPCPGCLGSGWVQ